MVEEPLGRHEARRSPKGAFKYLGLGVIAAILALLVWATLASSQGHGFVAQIASGKRPAAPTFFLPVIWPAASNWPASMRAALTDNKLTSAELRGHVVVINFFASWCLTCRDEAPYLHMEARKYRGRVLFLGIDVQDLPGDARGFAKKFRMNYIAIRDSSDTLYRTFGLTGVPETFYLDARGRAVAHSPGGVETKGIEVGIRAALASH